MGRLFRIPPFLFNAVLLALLLGAMFWALTHGSANVSWSELVNPTDPTASQILWSLRLPRILMAALVGAILAVTGLVYQLALRNALAEPYILGVSSAAACFGVIGQWLFGAAYLATLLSGFCGGLFCIGLLLTLHWMQRDRSEVKLLLTGVMINFFMGALMMLALFLTKSSRSPEVLYLWLGSFSGIWHWEIPTLALLLLIGTIYFGLYGRSLMTLALGDEWAANVGFDAAVLRRRALAVASLMVAAAVACVGMIGFVGLLVPHVMRLLLPMEMRRLLPATLLGGALFLVVADTVSRQLTLLQLELPVGVISAFIGSPLFIYLVFKRGRANA